MQFTANSSWQVHRGTSSLSLGAPQEPERAFLWLEKLSVTAAHDGQSHLCCPVSTTLGLRHCSKFWGCHVAASQHAWVCLLAPLQLIFVCRQVASTWMSRQAGLLSLCKKMSVPPSACLVCKNRPESGLVQPQRGKISRL